MASGPNDRLLQVEVAGLDLGTDPKVVQKGWLKVENGFFPRVGTVEKRKGVVAMTGTYSNNNFLVPYRDNPILLGVDGLYTPDFSSAVAGSWNKADELPLLDVEVTELASAAGGWAYAPDMMQLNDVLCVVFTIQTNSTDRALRAVTYSRLTGSVLAASDLISASSSTHATQRARTVVLGSTMYIFYSNNTNDLAFRTVSSAGAIASEVQVGVGASGDFLATNRYLDVCVFGASSDIAGICYANTGNDLQVVTVTEGLGLVSEGTPVSATAASKVGCFKQSDTVITVLWHDTNGGSDDGVYAQGFDTVAGADFAKTTFTTWTPSGSDTPFSLIGYRKTDTTSRVFVDYGTGSSGEVRIEWDDLNTATPAFAGAGTPNLFRHHCLIASKIFEPTYGDAQFFVVHVGNTSSPVSIQQSIFGITTGESSGDAGRMTASVMPARAGWRYYGATNVQSVGTDQWVSAMAVSLQHTADVDVEGIVKVEIAADPTVLNTAEALGALTIGSGLPQAFAGGSGRAVAEQGFLYYPEGLVLAEHGSGTDLPAGTYGFKAAYEYYDEAGNLHESSPSPNVSITTASAKDVNVTLPNLHLTNKGSKDEPISIVIYRTVDDGGVWYRCKVVANDLANANQTVQITNTPSDATLSTVDLEDPSSVMDAGRRQLYTTGNVLEHTAPHPYRASVVWQNRIFYVDRERESTTLFYSKEFIKGAGLAYSDVLRVDCTHQGGRIYALEVLDNRLLLFKEHSIYALQGQPLNDVASAGGFTPPYLISSTIGCAEPRSLVRFPGGLMFMGPDGLAMIGHSFEPQYVGQAVRHLTEVDGLTITGAYVMPPEGQVEFCTSDGTTLVFNYRYNLWSTYSNRAADGACYCNTTLYYKVASGSTVRALSRAVATDAGSNVAMTLETGTLSLSGLGGRWRIKRILLIGQARAAHTLGVKIAYNRETFWDALDSNTYDMTDASLLNAKYADIAQHYSMDSNVDRADKTFAIWVTPSRSKNISAIKLQLTDSASASTGYSLTAIAIEVAPAGKGAERVGVSRSVT